MECYIDDGWKLTSNVSWILDATTIHLATCWHVESLSHFLEIAPHIKDIQTSKYKFTPLHVAVSCDDETLATSLLIRKEANTEMKNANNQTPLHIASYFGFINNVITLLFEGNANVTALDLDESKQFLLNNKYKKKDSKSFVLQVNYGN